MLIIYTNLINKKVEILTKMIELKISNKDNITEYQNLFNKYKSIYEELKKMLETAKEERETIDALLRMTYGEYSYNVGFDNILCDEIIISMNNRTYLDSKNIDSNLFKNEILNVSQFRNSVEDLVLSLGENGCEIFNKTNLNFLISLYNILSERINKLDKNMELYIKYKYNLILTNRELESIVVKNNFSDYISSNQVNNFFSNKYFCDIKDTLNAEFLNYLIYHCDKNQFDRENLIIDALGKGINNSDKLESFIDFLLAYDSVNQLDDNRKKLVRTACKYI